MGCETGGDWQQPVCNIAEGCGRPPPRDRILTDAELARVWRACDHLGEPWHGFVRVLILTGQRRAETAGARWSEISAGFDTWTIPAERSKNGRAHDVPLSEPARELIRAIPRFEGCELVFSCGRKNPPSGFSKMKARLDALLAADGAGPVAPWILHDLRRTVATGLQRLGVRLEVTESVLNHIAGSRAGIVGVYQRHRWTDEKRAALDAWARHVLALQGPTP